LCFSRPISDCANKNGDPPVTVFTASTTRSINMTAIATVDAQEYLLNQPAG